MAFDATKRMFAIALLYSRGRVYRATDCGARSVSCNPHFPGAGKCGSPYGTELVPEKKDDGDDAPVARLMTKKMR